jgi:dTDP-glucose 4,6-dehydratase
MDRNKKILVTGADGFIGSHLTEMLVRQGYDVKAFVYYNSFNSWGWLDSTDKYILDSLDVFSGDIRDSHGIREAARGCDAILHLAALISIPFSYHSPEAYVDTNVKGTLNIVQAAQDLGISRIVCTSTSEVYGTAQFVPITEEHPLVGQSPYAATKIAADQIAMSFYRSFGTPVTILRPFNTFGPRQSARAVIPTIITQLLAGNTRIKLGSLHPTRDFTFVEDTARGFVAALNADNILGETINLGSNQEISIMDTANIIADVIGVELEIESDDSRLRPKLSEVERLWSDNSKARDILGWQPVEAGQEGFRRAIEATVAWFRVPENLSRYKADLYNV